MERDELEYERLPEDLLFLTFLAWRTYMYAYMEFEEKQGNILDGSICLHYPTLHPKL